VAQSTPSTSAQKAQRVSSSTQWRDPLPICTCGGQGDCNSRQRDGRPGTWAYDYLNLVPGRCFSDNVVVRYLCWTFLIRAKPPPVATYCMPWTTNRGALQPLKRVAKIPASPVDKLSNPVEHHSLLSTLFSTSRILPGRRWPVAN
jgi:hypothetical protein